MIANGAVFAQMPEGTVSGPAGRIGPFRVGWAVIALRIDAPIVPFAMAGTEELYVGRRLGSRILPPTSVAALLGSRWDGRLPEAGSRAELDLARELSTAMAAVLGPVVAELWPRTVPSAAPAPAAHVALPEAGPARSRGSPGSRAERGIGPELTQSDQPCARAAGSDVLGARPIDRASRRIWGHCGLARVSSSGSMLTTPDPDPEAPTHPARHSAIATPAAAW